LYAGVRGFLDNMLTSEIPKFEQKYLAFLRESHPKLINDILTSGELSKENDALLKTILDQFIPEQGFAMKA